MRNLLLFILILTSISVIGQDFDCEKIKNGKFKIVDSETGTSYIERKGSRQFEYGGLSKAKLEFMVKWLNDCTYTLKLKRVIDNPGKIPFPDGLILTVKIIEIKENSHILNTTSNLFDMVLESELFNL